MAVANRLGLHGLRVLGYNAGRAAMGEEVAALQGGWFSECHTTYGRETLNKILSMANLMAVKAASSSLPPMPLDSDTPIFAQEDHLFTDTTSFQPPAPRPPAPSDSDLGITRVQKQAAKRSYLVFMFQDKQFPSLTKAKAAKHLVFREKLQSFGYTFL